MKKIEIKTRDGLCADYVYRPQEGLAKALRDAKVDHQIETYPAKHGWVPTDTPVYDAEQSERHWRTMTQLFDAVLKAA